MHLTRTVTWAESELHQLAKEAWLALLGNSAINEGCSEEDFAKQGYACAHTFLAERDPIDPSPPHVKVLPQWVKREATPEEILGLMRAKADAAEPTLTVERETETQTAMRGNAALLVAKIQVAVTIVSPRAPEDAGDELVQSARRFLRMMFDEEKEVPPCQLDNR